MNLVAARGIVAVHEDVGVLQLAEISRTSRMIENHLLVKLFEFGAHAKNARRRRRISIMRSISAVVL